MPWIKQLSISEATGLLKAQLDQAVQRAGRVWHTDDGPVPAEPRAARAACHGCFV